MAYSPTTWRNGATPAINAPNLNKIEQGIVEAHRLAELSPFLNDFRITAGDNPFYESGTTRDTDSLEDETICRISLPYKGSFRIKFNAYTNVTGRNGSLYISKNGVRISSVYTITSNDNLAISYDVTNYNPGDLVTIVGKTTVSNGAVYASSIGVHISQLSKVTFE